VDLRRRARRGRSPAMLRWDLGDGEDETGSRRTRRSRSFDLGGQSSPTVTRRRGWRSWGGRELRELDDGVDLLQPSQGKGVRERRLIKLKRIEERRETGAHQGWRISPGMLADVRLSDEESLCGPSMNSRRSKGRWRRGVRALYRRAAWGRNGRY
jgi:hypothetical protein